MLILLRDNLCRNLERPLMALHSAEAEEIGFEVFSCIVLSIRQRHWIPASAGMTTVWGVAYQTDPLTAAACAAPAMTLASS